MSRIINLEIIEEQLKKWRASKKAGETIPETIWENIKSINGHYRISVIQKRLQLSRAQLVQQGMLEPVVTRKSTSDKKTTKTAGTKFVTMPPSQPAASTTSIMPITMTIQHPSGSRLEMTLTETKPLGDILHAFLQRGDEC